MDAGILVEIVKSVPQIGCGLAIQVPRLALLSRKCLERRTERQCGDKEGRPNGPYTVSTCRRRNGHCYFFLKSESHEGAAFE
jgi:hypothetical protein